MDSVQANCIIQLQFRRAFLLIFRLQFGQTMRISNSLYCSCNPPDIYNKLPNGHELQFRRASLLLLQRQFEPTILVHTKFPQMYQIRPDVLQFRRASFLLLQRQFEPILVRTEFPQMYQIRPDVLQFRRASFLIFRLQFELVLAMCNLRFLNILPRCAQAFHRPRIE